MKQPGVCGTVRDYVAQFTSVTRLLILCHLTQGEANVQDIAEAVERRQSTVSQHLKQLRTAGIVTRNSDGNRRLYRISDPQANEMMDFIVNLARRVAGKERE